MEPVKDAETTVETQDGAAADVLLSPEMGALEHVSSNPSHGGRYMQYNLSGHIFEVPAKYKPPIMALGNGSYGFVCSALNTETNEKVAIKKIANALENEIAAKRTLREIRILRHLKHENIIGIKDVMLPPKRDAFKDVYIAYELMDTDLYKVSRRQPELEEVHFQCFLYQILRGLKYMHSANVIHRDLKPNNILVNYNLGLKICDFGLARGTSENNVMSPCVCARWYCAPELLFNSCDYTTAIDIWSVGCVFYEMVTREPLFPGKDQIHMLRLQMEAIGSPSEDDLRSFNENAKRYFREVPFIPSRYLGANIGNAPFTAIDLMEKMLKFDPRKRISAEEALAHRYFDSMYKPNHEPVFAKPFTFDLEERPYTVEQVKELIYCEGLAFNPEPAVTENEH
ncbi:unnamed protein product [Thlaspi arvense]|uniref:mitogen-activated protein kinase n=1 Tax=Thlaspi arvense TaxID=13288 RepID=A0AAU9SGP6_THLAR|nr:unnamed protein product [Thlaspi arvense]